MNIDELVARATEVASSKFSTEVPERAATNTKEAEAVIVALLQRHEGMHISGRDLNKALESVGLKQEHIGNLLFSMKNRRVISSSGPASYTAYDSQYDHNITASKLRSEQENGETQSAPEGTDEG